MVVAPGFGIAAPAPLRRGTILLVALAILASLLLPVGMSSVLPKADRALLHAALVQPDSELSVIVREARPDSNEAEALTRELGGAITHELPIIGAFSARVPGRSLVPLMASPSVLKVWGDGKVRMARVDMGQYDSWAPNTVWRSVIQLPQSGNKYNGSGVTVAILDTGVIDSPDLGSRVLARVDFTPDHDGLDRYGHGTHLAGIIAGDGTSSAGRWMGVAPGANLVSVKVAGADGSTDVSVVIAGLQWVHSYRAQYGIKILNLSFGTDSRQSYLVDPLNYAVEQLWFAGVLVVVAAGNRGPDSGTINKPADDPFVLTVGAASVHDSADRTDDAAASFSSRGPTQDGVVKPDMIAPGVSLVSLRVPGSTIDLAHPTARVEDLYFKGTGTSQAAAVTSGVAARLYQQDPGLTPDVLKNILMRASYKGIKTLTGAGKGLADGNVAHELLAGGSKDPANVGVIRSTGVGSLDLSRGSHRVYADLPGDGLGALDLDGKLDLVTGELDALGNSWSAISAWWGNSWGGNSWSKHAWGGNSWSGDSWSGTSWSSNFWSGNSWSGDSWSGDSWSGNSWNGNSWGVAELGIDALVLRYGNSWS
jgi:serine protease AprX